MLPITQRTLAPGVTLRVVQTKKFKTSMLSATFLAPLTEETASLNALLPQVLRRGTQDHPDMEALSAALDDLYGGGIEPIVRKKGEVQCVGFWGSFLDDAFVPGDSHILESAAALLGELILRPAGEGEAFVPAYVDSEKANLIDQIRGEVNDKLQYSLSRLRSLMCQGEAYGIHKLGSEAQAQAITGQALYARYRQLLETAPLHLYYCGSAEPDRVEAAFRAALTGLPRGQRQPAPVTQSIAAPAGEVRRFTDRLDVTQGKLTIGFRVGGGFREKEDVARAMLFNAIYGGSTNSKLFLNVREKLSLCYFASSSLVLSKGVLLVYSGVEFSNFQKAEEEILAQLAACQEGKITKEELESARRSVMSSLRTSLDAQGRLEEYWLGRFVTGTGFTPEELAAAVEAVTLDQVVEMARQVRLDSVYTLRGRED
ncbi:MAG: insulinase family protein [Clostridiales bacterium]|nr:insulinase family protein [Clostridiales bacterium]